MSDNDDILKKEINVIRLKLVESLGSYRKLMDYMAADAPIGILGLPKTIETILSNNGLTRVYDLLDRDLAEIKGIGVRRARDLTSSLNQFLSMQ